MPFVSFLLSMIFRTVNDKMGLEARKPVFGGLRTTKGADQPAHPRSLIIAFVNRVLERTISKLAIGGILIFYLVSVAVETGLSAALSEPRRQVFSRRGPNNSHLTGVTSF